MAVTTDEFNIQQYPNIPVTLTGNAEPNVMAASSIKTTAWSVNGTEVALAVGMDTGTTGMKVALYSGCQMRQGSNYGWGANILLNLATNAGKDMSGVPLTNFAGQGLELDVQNNSGIEFGNAGFGPPAVWGINVSALGSRISAGYSMQGIFNYGYLALSDISKFAFMDMSNASSCFLATGSHYSGFDFGFANLTVAARLGNSQLFASMNGANNTNLAMMLVNRADQLVLGDPLLSSIILQKTILPMVDNAYACGIPTNRWSVGYFAGGTYTTSDPSVKDNIKPLDDVFPVLDLLKPVQFTRTDGVEMVEVEEEQLVQDTEIQTFQDTTVEIIDGKPVRVNKPFQGEVPAFDTVPVLDESGQQAMDVYPAKPEILNDKGEVVRPFVPERRVPKTHPMPRMVKKMVKVSKPVSKISNSVHIGFLADNVKEAVAPLTDDFAGHITGEDGKAHLNLEQLIGIAIQACKQLRAENAELRALIADKK